MHLEYSLPFFYIPYIFSTFVFYINTTHPKYFQQLQYYYKRKKNKEINRKKIDSG